MSTTGQPTITESFVNHYDRAPTVVVEPYRTSDRFGTEVQIRKFQQDTGNGSIWPYGAKIRKDGQPANQRQILPGITIPANVRAALEALQTTDSTEDVNR